MRRINLSSQVWQCSVSSWTYVQALMLCLAMATTALNIFIRNTVDSCLVFFCLFLHITFLFVLLFGIFLLKPLPTVQFPKTYFLWWPSGLLAFLSATAWLHGDTKQAALLEQPVQPAATFSSDSLGLMSWWSSPDITGLCRPKCHSQRLGQWLK